MSELGTEASRLVRVARLHGGPTTAQRARVRDALVASLALAPGSASAAASLKGSSVSLATAGPPLASKLMVLVAAGVVGGAGLLLSRRSELKADAAADTRPQGSAQTASASAAPTPLAALALPPAAGPLEAPRPRPTGEPRTVAVAPASALPSPMARPAATAPPTAPTAPTPVVADALPPAPEATAVVTTLSGPPLAPAPRWSLADEVGALDAVSAAVQAQRWDAVLDGVNAFHAAFPHGTLEVEAMALETQALCGKGRTADARALVKLLLATDANNPAVQRLRSGCAGDTFP